MDWFCVTMADLSSKDRDSYYLQNLQYLLSRPLQKKFVDTPTSGSPSALKKGQMWPS